MKNKLIFIAVLLLMGGKTLHSKELTSYKTAKDHYLCVTTAAAGFHANSSTKTWTTAIFSTDDLKYLLKKDGEGGWIWKRFGSEDQTYCPNTSEWYAKIGFISCKTMSGSFDLNLNTLKFVNAYTFGYTDNATDNKNTPHIAIGTCSPL